MSKTYSIVGMNYTKTEDFVRALPPGRPVFLVREPFNDFDANAVAVWIDGRKVGYIPKKQNVVLAGFIDQTGIELTMANVPHVAMDAALDVSVIGAAGAAKMIEAKFVRSPNSGYPMVEV